MSFAGNEIQSNPPRASLTIVEVILLEDHTKSRSSFAVCYRLRDRHFSYCFDDPSQPETQTTGWHILQQTTCSQCDIMYFEPGHTLD